MSRVERERGDRCDQGEENWVTAAQPTRAHSAPLAVELFGNLSLGL